MPGIRRIMAFEGLENEKPEQPPEEVTSSGGVTLPPISGGVPSGE
jgi:hypothetical protein